MKDKGSKADSVALVKYEGDLGKALKEAVELLGGFRVFKTPIIIKPNICTDDDATGVANTNVKVVEALIKLLIEENKDLSIRIVESDSEMKFADEAFEKFGYKSLERRFRDSNFDVSLINLSHSPMDKVELDGFYFKNPELPKILTRSRYFISVAVPKTHGLTLVTGALKNLFGLLPRKNKRFYHPHINGVVVDLNRFVKPDLCVIDAIMGLEGVLSGRPRKVNTLIVGRKPVSVDAIMARMMGFEPEKIRHLVWAERYDLGTLYPNVLGKSLESMTVKFKPPSNLNPTALINC